MGDQKKFISRLERTRRWRGAFETGRVAISILFAMAIVGVYYFANTTLKQVTGLADNWIHVIITALALIVLIPAREFFTRRWEAFTRGRNFSLEANFLKLLDLLGRRTSFDEFRSQQFPMLMDKLGMPHGLFMILERKGRNFALYYYSGGRLKKIPRVSLSHRDPFLRRLHTTLVRSGRIIGEVEIHGVRQRLIRMNSGCFVALSYREKLVGFWGLPFTPVGKENQDLVKAFAVKGALIIHNEFLAPSLVGQRVLRQEFIVADKISTFLKSTPIPEIPGYKLVFRGLRSGYLEFLNEEKFIYIINLSRGPSGVGLAGMMGAVYAAKVLKPDKYLQFLTGYLREDLADLQRLSILVVHLRLNRKNPGFSYDVYGEGFSWGLRAGESREREKIIPARAGEFIEVSGLSRQGSDATILDDGGEPTDLIFYCQNHPFLRLKPREGDPS